MTNPIAQTTHDEHESGRKTDGCRIKLPDKELQALPLSSICQAASCSGCHQFEELMAEYFEREVKPSHAKRPE